MYELGKDYEPICSFCGKTSKYVGRMLSGIENIYICENCVRECTDILDEKEVTSFIKTQKRLLRPPEIKKYLDNYIIGQDMAKKALAITVYNHYKRIEIQKNSDIDLKKSNIMMIGPTGSGKTFLTQTIARVLDVPFVCVDATTFTEAGYVGDNVENILARLFKESGDDINRAEQGIIYIDEIDKIAKKSGNNLVARDVSGEGVQQALLKMLEGTEVTVPINDVSKGQRQKTIQIKTNDILFICSGAFNGLDEIVEKRTAQSVIGFNTKPQYRLHENTKINITSEDLQKYGLIPEFIGRIPIIVQLNELTINELKSILYEPKNSLIKQYKELFLYDNVELRFQDDSMGEIASIAFHKGNGARGLKSILEEILMEIMYLIPFDNNQRAKCVVTLDTIKNKELPQILYL